MSATVTKSCGDCIFFSGDAETSQTLGRSVNFSVCNKLKKVLTNPQATSQENDIMRREVAGKCESFVTRQGIPNVALEPRRVTAINGMRDFPRLPVSFPDPDAFTNQVSNQDLVRGCTQCVNFSSDSVVSSEYGFNAGHCAARGDLILNTRQVKEARNCSQRSFGANRNQVRDLALLPEFTAFQPPDPMAAFLAGVQTWVEPTAWPTDKEVTDEEQEGGIRAWRLVPDPTDPLNEERRVFLPIYETTFFPEEHQDLIPKSGSDSHPEMYVDHFGGVYMAAVCWMELDETPALWGEAGTGKTELFRHLAWLMNLPFYRISVTASTELDDLAGKTHFSPDKGTYFSYGRLPIAWQSPGVICLDEPNTGQPDVWQWLRPLTDNSKQLVMDMNGGEALDRHLDCFMGMAMNPAWDPKNVGTQQIGDADANRLFHVQLGLPPKEVEEAIIGHRVKLDGWSLTIQQTKLIMGVAADLRALILDGTLTISWAIRPQIKVARALRWFDPVTAYKRAVADYLEPEVAQIVLDTVRAHATRR